MSVKRILIVQDHPDPRGDHLGHALARAYADGAAEAGHRLRRVDETRIGQVDKLDFKQVERWCASPRTLGRKGA